MRILVVSFWCPFPPDNGSRLRAYHLIKQLAERGHEIKLLALAQPESEITAAQEALSDICAGGVTLFPSRFFQPHTLKSLLGFFSPRPRHLLDTYQPEFAQAVADACLSGRWDLALAMELGAAHYLPPHPSLPCVLDQLEVSPFVRAVQEASSFKSRFRRSLTLRKLRGHLRSLAARYSLWLAVSKGEAQAICRVTGGSAPPVEVLPNGVDLEYNTYQPHSDYAPDHLVYNGAPNFLANAEAVRWFSEAILPKIQQGNPQTRLQVTGRNDALPPEDSLRHHPGIILTGFLGDVRPVVRRSAACVVPLRAGGGTRLKILEAMALGVPVVSTPLGADGLAVTDGEDIVIASQPADFAEAALRLMTNRDWRGRIGLGGRRLVEKHYGWQALGAMLDERLNRLREERKN